MTSGTQEQALQQQLAERNKPRLDDRDESLKLWGRKIADLMLASYKKKHVKRVLGEKKADDWDELTKTKRGEFDVRIQVGAGISGDPEAVMNLAMQLHERGILGAPEDPQTRMTVLEIVRKVWPGADGLIREMKKAVDAQREAEVQQMTGAPPEGAAGPASSLPPAPVPGGAPLPPPPQPAPVGAPL